MSHRSQITSLRSFPSHPTTLCKNTLFAGRVCLLSHKPAGSRRCISGPTPRNSEREIETHPHRLHTATCGLESGSPVVQQPNYICKRKDTRVVVQRESGQVSHLLCHGDPTLLSVCVLNKLSVLCPKKQEGS